MAAMKYRRLRMAAATGSIVAVVLWIASMFAGIAFVGPRLILSLHGGMFNIVWPLNGETDFSSTAEFNIRAGESAAPVSVNTRWNAGLVPPSVVALWGVRVAYLPLWIPALSLGAMWFILRRLGGPGIPLCCCQRCGYDLRGAAHDRCPECGVPTPAEQSSRLATPDNER